MELTLGTITSYLAGAILILGGVAGLTYSPLAVVVLLAGILVLPPLRRRIADSTGVELSRGLTATVAVVGLVLMVGVLSTAASNQAESGATVSNVTVDGNSTDFATSDTTLSVRYHARAQEEVDPSSDDLSTYRADDGQKFVVIAVEIANEGPGQIDLRPRLFKLESDGVLYDRQVLFGSNQGGLGQKTLQPNATATGWLIYSIPNSTTQATLTTDQSVYIQSQIGVQFTEDNSLELPSSD